MRLVDLPTRISGKLFLHSMPGLNEPWDVFLADATDKAIEQVFCLTPIDEIEQKSPAYALAIKTSHLGFQLIRCPIQDLSVPSDKAAFMQQVKAAASAVTAGGNILVHCAAGIGRTGTFASCVLQELGIKKKEARALIRDAKSMPETTAQKAFIDAF